MGHNYMGIWYFLLVLMFAVIGVPGPVPAVRHQVAILGALHTRDEVVSLA